jgi:heterodisulfide reductase subunit C
MTEFVAKKKDFNLIEIEETITEAIKKCYTCGKCTSGCPMAEEMDFPPSLLVKRLSIGDIEKMLRSNTIWLCSSCQMCYSRCPFAVNIPHIIDLMKGYADNENITEKEKATRLFHNLFLSNIKESGRIHELGLIGKWKTLSGKWFTDLKLGKKMFLKGKLSPFPEKIKARDEVKRFFYQSNRKKEK